MSTLLEIPEWTGSTLTIGAFSEYVGRVVAKIQLYGYSALALDQIGRNLEVANNRLAEFINRQRAYDETPAIAKADANRDALWKALYHAWSYVMQLDSSHPLYASALKLRSEMTPYKGVDRHEISKETSELKGLQRDLAKSENAAALTALGLNTIATALFAANGAVEEALSARETERGARIGEKGGETTASLRKEVATLLVESYRQVNAVARINPSETVESAIRDFNGIIAHYRDVAAQPAKRSGKDEPAPEPDPEASAS